MVDIFKQDHSKSIEKMGAKKTTIIFTMIKQRHFAGTTLSFNDANSIKQTN